MRKKLAPSGADDGQAAGRTLAAHNRQDVAAEALHPVTVGQVTHRADKDQFAAILPSCRAVFSPRLRQREKPSAVHAVFDKADPQVRLLHVPGG